MAPELTHVSIEEPLLISRRVMPFCLGCCQVADRICEVTGQVAEEKDIHVQYDPPKSQRAAFRRAMAQVRDGYSVKGLHCCLMDCQGRLLREGVYCCSTDASLKVSSVPHHQPSPMARGPNYKGLAGGCYRAPIEDKYNQKDSFHSQPNGSWDGYAGGVGGGGGGAAGLSSMRTCGQGVRGRWFAAHIMPDVGRVGVLVCISFMHCMVAPWLSEHQRSEMPGFQQAEQARPLQPKHMRC
jgi:hypothetical protein